jgi:large subunit ribosomal protein L21
MQRVPPEGGISLSRGGVIYAILRTGGRQFRVEEGRTLRVPRIDAEEGARVELPDVLLLARDGGDVTVGAPLVQGARVIAEVTAQGRERKLTVFKYKSKVRYRRKRGHRQRYTELRIERILAPGETLEEAAPKRQRRKAAEPAEAPAEAPAAPEAEATAPKPRARRPRAEAPAEGAETAAEERPKRTRAKRTEESPEGGE